MIRRIPSALAVGCLAIGTATIASMPAGAVPGPGTFTRITTPSGTTSIRFTPNPVTTFDVAGTASSDITAVDVICVKQPGLAEIYGFNIPVSTGAFSATIAYPFLNASDTVPACRLRAVPHGLDASNPNTYLASYAGPILHTDSVTPDRADGTTYGFELRAGTGAGAIEGRDFSSCGTSEFVTQSPSDFV